MNIYCGDNSPLYKPCGCSLTGDNDTLACLGLDSVLIYIYQNKILVKKAHTNKKGRSNFNLGAGIYNITCIKDGMDTVYSTLTLPDNADSSCTFSQMTTAHYISLLDSYSSGGGSDDFYCCSYMPWVEKKKSGVRIVPKN